MNLSRCTIAPWTSIQLTQEGHAMIAAALLPRVMEILDRRRSDVPPAEMHPGPRRRGDTGL
jgi:hypothetical protein